MSFLTRTIECIRIGYILLSHIVFYLRHRQIEEIGGRLLADRFHIIEELLLHLLVLQRFYLPRPAERIVPNQILAIPNAYRNRRELIVIVFAKRTHVAQIGIEVETAAQEVEILRHVQISARVEGLLLTVDIQIGFRVVPSGNIAIVLRRGEVQREAGQPLRLIITVFPLAGQIQILASESLQRTIRRQLNRFLERKFNRLSRYEGSEAKKYRYQLHFHYFFPIHILFFIHYPF